MAREEDAQLIEAVGVRRARLREASLWGRDRRRLSAANNVRRLLVGVVVAAVCSAGCVGVGFVQQALADRASSSGTTR